MDRYKLFEHPETNEFDCGGMWLNDDGDYVRASEAQAEIARLQAALARTEQNRDDILNDLHTAWNDAIEAAYKCADQGASAYQIRQEIRALRKP